MPFVKLIKNTAYFSRFQVQYRRRREGKTDYLARKRLVAQDKAKYNSPKFRLVVRFSNSDIICQIVYSKITGDVVMSSAYSHELPRYGIPVGLTNYSAAYATGLLIARRHLTKVGLATRYVGKVKADGADFTVEAAEKGPRPFLANLDVGLSRTTTGARVFGALKGALDGGLNVPHSEKRFFGYDRTKKKLDTAKLRKVIFGGHVAEYMQQLSKANPGKYKKQFSKYIRANMTHDRLESMYQKAHDKIRASPAAVKSTKKHTGPHQSFKMKKITLAQRKRNVNAKLALIKQRKHEKSAKAVEAAASE